MCDLDGRRLAAPIFSLSAPLRRTRSPDRPPMKWKLWLRQLSVSAPRVAVRTQLPWALRLALLAGAGFAAAAGLYAVYEVARQTVVPGGNDRSAEIAQLQAQLTKVTAERERSAAQAVQADNQLNVERATREQFGLQLKALEEDNGRLKADLAFFESLLPAPAAARGVVIRSFKLQPDADDGSLRYRLLVQQSRPERDFAGDVTLAINLVKDGRALVMKLPDAALPAAGPPRLAFRHYQRVEGSFPLPPGAVVRSVQVTISAGGEQRVQQTFAM
jgi:hypothetical protein